MHTDFPIGTATEANVIPDTTTPTTRENRITTNATSSTTATVSSSTVINGDGGDIADGTEVDISSWASVSSENFITNQTNSKLIQIQSFQLPDLSNEISPADFGEVSSDAIDTQKKLNEFNLDSYHFNLSSLVNGIYESIVEHLALGIFFDFYKAHTLNSIKSKEYSNHNDTSESKPSSKGDIFGQSFNGIKKLECVCPNCSRALAASRLAPHLEKCLGMGRNSSRLALKRIALVIKNSNGSNWEG